MMGQTPSYLQGGLVAHQAASVPMAMWALSTQLLSTKHLTLWPRPQAWSSSQKTPCTEWHGAQTNIEQWTAKQDKVNENTYENFRKAISELVADEAADEGRARELLTDEPDES